MSVFITGATGVLGRRLVDRFAERGYDVVGLARDDDGARLIEQRGGTACRGDVLDRETLAQAVTDDVEVLIHAATAIPESPKPSEEAWARNDRVRLTGLENVLAVAPPSVKQVLFPSVVWVARQPDGSRPDETAPRHPDRATQSAADAEDLLRDRASKDGFDAAILRCGFFYAPDARDARDWGARLCDGDLPIVGGGLRGRKDADLSFVHADDAAAAFVGAVETQARGTYHIVDDEPVTGAKFFETLADLLEAPPPSRVPAWLARFFIGKINANGFTSPMPTTNEKAKRDLDWQPAYPTIHDGLARVVEVWEANGTLSELRGDATCEPDTAPPQEAP